MTKRAILILVLITMIQMFMIANISYAIDGWEISITARVLNAENKLIIGQRPDASDGIDGRYDVPAFLAGDIKAYMELKDDVYWGDIKQTCNTPCKKTWDIVVESGVAGQMIHLNWKASDIPEHINIFLIDVTTGEIIGMKGERSYSYQNNGQRQFRIEVASW